MRIFMLVQHERIRGPVARHTPHLVAALRSLGTSVVTHPWGREREEDERLPDKVVRALGQVLSVRRALAGEEFDVAVVKTSHDWRTLARDIPVVLAIRGRCRPIVLQFHGSQPSALVKPGRWAFTLVTALLLALVDGVMVLSTEEQAEWRAFRARPPVFAVKNPYVRSPVLAERPRARSPEDAQVLFVGRLLEAKGIFDLVEAFAAVLEPAPCKLVFVGLGEDDRRLRERIHRLGLNNHVAIKGYLEGAELGRVYGEATLLALPTRWPEGFPTVLAEAMDAGLPIVTTRIRGAADHLVEGEHALFVEPRDVRGIASAIITLLRDPELRARMGSANRERVRIFDPEAVGAEYLECLRSLAPVAPLAFASGHELT
jgi:glycosyltransferase involved in cell wall biosynthesis